MILHSARAAAARIRILWQYRLAPRVTSRIEVAEVGQHIAALVTVVAPDGEPRR